MKKLIICLFSIFCLFSCCNNDPNNSYEIIKAANNDLQVELIYNNEIGTDNLGQKSEPPFQRIYTFKFRGHKYIDFDGFRRTGVVHDPDCSCYKK